MNIDKDEFRHYHGPCCGSRKDGNCDCGLDRLLDKINQQHGGNAMESDKSSCCQETGPMQDGGESLRKAQSIIRKEEVLKSLDNIFVYHAPKGDQTERYQSLRDQAKELARAVVEKTPYSREQSLAITAIQQAIMWANAAIAINE